MKRAIVIDFDNTIGYFKQIVYLLNIIERTQKKIFEQKDVDNLMRLYPRVIRPRMNEVFTLINKMKNKNKIQYFILYTTNNNKRFVNMIVDYIERILGQESKPLFDSKIFSSTKVKPVHNLLEDSIVNTNIPITLCYVDNKKLNCAEDYAGITSIFMKCDTYRYLYDIRDIIKIFDYSLYNNLTKKIIVKYFTYIYNKTTFTNLPYQLNEMNSIYLINVISDFCYSSRPSIRTT